MPSKVFEIPELVDCIFNYLDDRDLASFAQVCQWPEMGAVWVNRFLTRCLDLFALDIAEANEASDSSGISREDGGIELPSQQPPHLRHLMIHHALRPTEYQKIGSYLQLTRLLLSDISDEEHLLSLIALPNLTHLLLPFSSLGWEEGFRDVLTHLGGSLLALDLSRDIDLDDVLTLSWITGIVSLCPNLEQVALDGWTGTTGSDALAAAKILWMGLPRLRALSILSKPLDITPLEKRALEDAMAVGGWVGLGRHTSTAVSTPEIGRPKRENPRFYFRAIEPVTVGGWNRREADEHTFWDTAHDWELDVLGEE
ncbi:hypothetical protein HDU93_009358 [Gonapodya sp. JEL0774]|nr:hypothetical protein HDU93_009358 [Gonapodya sp. JEL0774]